MWTAEAVLVCALNMLGRSQSSMPPIELVTAVPVTVSRGAEGYVQRNDPRIYLVVNTENFQAARQSFNRCGNAMAIRKVASVLIHEEAHLRHGADEKAAYQAQLTILTALGAGVGSPPYQEVMRAMQHTLALERRSPTLLAAAQP
jgi:hypothetical protein